MSEPVDPDNEPYPGAWEDEQLARLDDETKARIWDLEKPEAAARVGEAGDVTDAEGRDVIPVWLIETDTLRLMSKDQLLDYVDTHRDWRSYTDSFGHVRWKHASPADPPPGP